MYNKAYHLQVKAHRAVAVALYNCSLTRLPCEVCGGVAQAHHDSYHPDRWLDVRWLCGRHHREWHEANEPEWPDVFDYHPSDDPPKEYRPRGGRPSKPWFRTSMQSWYVRHDGRQVNLGPDPEKAHERFLEMKRGVTESSR